MQLKYLDKIMYSKNLLAFSAGEDSSVLYDLLYKNNISFDMIMINYNLRTQSIDEVNYAKELSIMHNKQLFLKEINMKNFNEEKARNIRYEYFDEVMNNYDNLIFAHHANDRLEWFMMQLSKGAGFLELNSFKGISKRNNYTIIKPLINISKNEILEYSKSNNIKTFFDVSNNDESIKRNWFRHNISNKLMNEYKEGILNSFNYLDADEEILEKLEIIETNVKNYFKFIKSKNEISNFRAIDKIFKLEFNRVLSTKQRNELIKSNYNSVIDNIVIQSNELEIHIAPFVKINMTKDFKEQMRKNKIPSNIRGYLFKVK